MEMTSRERVVKAIERKEPDRVPICFGGGGTGIVESIPNGLEYTRLCQHLGFYDRPSPGIAEWLCVVTNVDERVILRLHSDFRFIGPNVKTAKVEKDGSKSWETCCGVRIKRVGLYDEPTDFPMRDMTSIRDIKNYPWPNPKDVIYTQGLRENARKLHEETNYAIDASNMFYCFPFALYAFLTGMDRWLTDIKLNTDFYFALSDKLLELGLEMSTIYLREIGDYIDMIETYDDVGTQEGLMMSHEDYRRFYHPYTKQIMEHVKKHTCAKVWRHTCGSSYGIIRDLIELGVDIVHPVQPAARNQEPWRLKREFGADISFMTGIDIQRDLPNKTPAQVRESVAEIIRTYGPGGGLIVAPTHNIEPDTPPENIVAAFDAAKDYGTYPIRQ